MLSPMSHLSRLDHCTNCSAPLPLQEPFCPYCGQKNIDRKISLWVFFKEFLGEYTRLDAKLLRSMISLITKPGFLTREYWAGRRKAYLRPTQIFLFMGLITFLLFSWMIEINNSSSNNLHVSFNEGIESINGKSYFERHIQENVAQAKKNPLALIQKVLKQLPLSLLVLLPVYAFFVKLFFRKKSPYLVEHFVHLLHIHAFIFLVGAIFSFVGILGFRHALLNWIAFLAIIIYIFISLKRVYQEKTGRLLVKWFFLAMIYLLLMPLGSLLVSMFISLLF